MSNTNNNNVSSSYGLVEDVDFNNLLQVSLDNMETDEGLELLADVIVGVAFGWYVSPEESEGVQDEEEEIMEEDLSIEDIASVNPDKGMYRTVVKEDREIETGFTIVDKDKLEVVRWIDDVPEFDYAQTFIPYHVLYDNSRAYFTTSGENPVIFDRAQINEDNRSAGGSSDVDWEYGLPTNLDSYINSLYWEIKGHEAFERRDRTSKWINLISEQPADADLGRYRKLFWKRIYDHKNNGSQYMTSKQVQALAKEFRRKGSYLCK